MRIITTTLEDFVANEIAENGFDYVEAQFLLGYEPQIVNGVWCWVVKKRLTLGGISHTSVFSTQIHA